jgi:hypothetical protein
VLVAFDAATQQSVPLTQRQRERLLAPAEPSGVTPPR